MSRAAACVVLAASCLLPAAGRAAEERLDHKGALALWLGGGVGLRIGTTAARRVDGGLRAPVDLGLFFALPQTQNGLWVVGRGALGGGLPDWSVRGGYRGFFGLDRWKTFFDLGATFAITPRFAAAVRAGAGAQVELSPVAGLFLAAGGEVGGGNGFHFAADLTLGIELRTYLFE